MRLRDHDKDELCFYSKATTDFEFLFPFGWGELWGVADRTDYDLNPALRTLRGKPMDYFDPETNEKYIPYVIEPSLGADRVLLAFLCDAYDEETDRKGTMFASLCTSTRHSPPLRPRCCRSRRSSRDKATEIYSELSKDFMIDL